GLEIRMLTEIPGEPPRARPSEASHASRHVGRESGARHLAVVADVDAGRELPRHHVTDGRRRLALEGAGVDGLPPVLAHEQITQGGRPGKTPHMGHENPVVAPDHGAAYVSLRCLCPPSPRKAGAGSDRSIAPTALAARLDRICW